MARGAAMLTAGSAEDEGGVGAGEDCARRSRASGVYPGDGSPRSCKVNIMCIMRRCIFWLQSATVPS